MKSLLVFIAACFATALCNAQLSNTRWKSTLKLENPVNVIFDFKNDTASVYTVADSTLIETMNYTSDGTSLSLTKISGQSDCDNTPGKYKYRIENNILYLNLLQDGCDDRWVVIDSTKWTRWIDHTEVSVEETTLRKYIGIYQLDNAHPITVSYENGKLYAEGPNNKLPKSPLMAISKTKFFLKIAGVEWDFVTDANGKVSKLISHEQQDYELKKVK